MASIFTRIVAREIPAHILREDSDFLAFLDVRPIRQTGNFFRRLRSPAKIMKPKPTEP